MEDANGGELVNQLFGEATIEIGDLGSIVEDLQKLGGLSSDVVILLMILYKWDIESLRADIEARDRVHEVSAFVPVNAPNDAGATFPLHCNTCARMTVFVRCACSHDLCVDCVSGLVEEALQTTSMPRCTLCNPHTLLKPDFIVNLLNPRVSDTYKQSLVNQINAFHCYRSKAKRFLSKHKLRIAVGIAGVGLLFLVYKLGGGTMEALEFNSADPPAGKEESMWEIKDIVNNMEMVKDMLISVEAWKASRPARSAALDKAVSLALSGEDPLKPQNMWEIIKTMVKTASKKYLP